VGTFVEREKPVAAPFDARQWWLLVALVVLVFADVTGSARREEAHRERDTEKQTTAVKTWRRRVRQFD